VNGSEFGYRAMSFVEKEGHVKKCDS